MSNRFIGGQQLQYFKNKIKVELDKIKSDIGETRYKLYITMVEECNDYDELRELAELELEMDYLDYVKNNINNRLQEKSVDIKDLRKVCYPPYEQDAEDAPLEEDDLEEDIESEETQDLLAFAMFRRLQEEPLEEQGKVYEQGVRIGQDVEIPLTEEEELELMVKEAMEDEEDLEESYGESLDMDDDIEIEEDSEDYFSNEDSEDDSEDSLDNNLEDLIEEDNNEYFSNEEMDDSEDDSEDFDFDTTDSTDDEGYFIESDEEDTDENENNDNDSGEIDIEDGTDDYFEESDEDDDTNNSLENEDDIEMDDYFEESDEDDDTNNLLADGEDAELNDDDYFEESDEPIEVDDSNDVEISDEDYFTETDEDTTDDLDIEEDEDYFGEEDEEETANKSVSTNKPQPVAAPRVITPSTVFKDEKAQGMFNIIHKGVIGATKATQKAAEGASKIITNKLHKK